MSCRDALRGPPLRSKLSVRFRRGAPSTAVFAVPVAVRAVADDRSARSATGTTEQTSPDAWALIPLRRLDAKFDTGIPPTPTSTRLSRSRRDRGQSNRRPETPEYIRRTG